MQLLSLTHVAYVVAPIGFVQKGAKNCVRLPQPKACTPACFQDIMVSISDRLCHHALVVGKHFIEPIYMGGIYSPLYPFLSVWLSTGYFSDRDHMRNITTLNVPHNSDLHMYSKLCGTMVKFLSSFAALYSQIAHFPMPERAFLLCKHGRNFHS